MKQINIILLTLCMSTGLFAQDIIVEKNGNEIESKILEVGLSIVKYKKFDNLNGPTFEILKSQIFMIKYENGTKDVFNKIDQKKEDKPKASNLVEDDSRDRTLAFTSNHRSTSIAYGVGALIGGITRFDGYESSKVIGPLMFGFDRALSEKFSIAFRPAAMYYTTKSSYNGMSIYEASLFFGGVQLRIDFHFGTTDKLDPYVGLGGGVGYFFGGDDVAGLTGTHPIYGSGFGIKYYGKSKNALLIELGYDSYSYLKVGYTFGGQK